MSLIVGCAKCAKKFKIGDEKAGRKMKCSGCGEIIQVPGGEPAANRSKPLTNEMPASSDRIKTNGQLTCPSCHESFTPRLPRPGNPLRCPHCKEVHPTSPIAETHAEQRERLTAHKNVNVCPSCGRTLSPHASWCVNCDRDIGVTEAKKSFIHTGYTEREEESMRRKNLIVGLLDFVGKTLWILFLLGTFRWGRLFNYLHSQD